MKLKFGLAALALVAMPSFAMAAGCGMGKSREAASCADGMAWDSETRTCQPVASS